MSYLTDLFQAVRTVTVAALPELDVAAGGGGIWQALQLTRQDFKTVVTLGRVPFAVINFVPQPAMMGEYGKANAVDVFEVQIGYTVESTSDVEALAERLRILQAYFRTNYSNRLLPNNSGQVILRPYISLDLGLPANQFFAAARWDYFVGALILPQVVTGYTPG